MIKIVSTPGRSTRFGSLLYRRSELARIPIPRRSFHSYLRFGRGLKEKLIFGSAVIACAPHQSNKSRNAVKFNEPGVNVALRRSPGLGRRSEMDLNFPRVVDQNQTSKAVSCHTHSRSDKPNRSRDGTDVQRWIQTATRGPPAPGSVAQRLYPGLIKHHRKAALFG